MLRIAAARTVYEDKQKGDTSSATRALPKLDLSPIVVPKTF